MKCLNCQTKGKHFDKKICPPCTDNGVTRDQIKVERKSMTFIGDDCGDEAGKYVVEMQNKGKNISHVRFNFKQHPYNSAKNEVKLTWSEYANTGGTDGNKKANKSK